MQIAKKNPAKLTRLSYKADAQGMWKAVREIIGNKTRPPVNNGNLSASDLNNYYASISHDLQYTAPPIKKTAVEKTFFSRKSNSFNNIKSEENSCGA